MIKIYLKEIKQYGIPMKILTTLGYITCLLFPVIIAAFSGFFAYHIGRITYNTFIIDKDMMFTCFGAFLTSAFTLLMLAVVLKTIVLLVDENKFNNFYKKHIVKRM